MSNITISQTASKISSVFRIFINKTAFVFALIVFVFSLIGILFTGSDIEVAALPCSMLLWTVLFALLVSAVGLICDMLKRKNINSVLLYSVHFLLSYISYLLVYVLGGGASAYLNETAVTNFALKIIVMTLIFIGLYVIVFFVKIGYALIKNRLINNNKEYENIYQDTNQPTQ